MLHKIHNVLCSFTVTGEQCCVARQTECYSQDYSVNIHSAIALSLVSKSHTVKADVKH